MKKMIVIVAVFLGVGVQAQQISKKSKSCKTTLQVWNVDSKGLFLIYNEHKTSAEKIAKAIAESGHDTDTIEASQARYEQLHFCCQYRE
jgi:mercuric ion binding protein